MPLDPTGEQVAQHGLDQLLRLRLVREVKVTQPAAGANATQNVTAGQTWELLSIALTLVNSAVAGNRRIQPRILDGDGLVVYSAGSSQTIGPGTTSVWTFANGLGVVQGSGDIAQSLPAVPPLLLSGWSLLLQNSGGDVGDQISNVILMVRSWSEANVVQNAQKIAKSYAALTVDK